MSNKIIAVPGLDPSAAGLMVWWRLDGSVEMKALREAAEAHSFAEEQLPPRVKPQAAMRRAVQEQSQVRRLVRPLEDRSGYALVDEDAKAKDLDYSIELKVSFNPQEGMLEFEPQEHPLINEIETAFMQHLRQLATTDISSWLVRQAYGCRAVSLRDTGGFYFIHRDHTAEWHKVVSMLRTCSSHVISNIQALQNSEAVDAILDALTREAEAEIDNIKKVLYPDDGVQPGARALKNRAGRTESFTDKVSEYEVLLGTKLDEIRAQLGELQAELVTATLVAEDE